MRSVVFPVNKCEGSFGLREGVIILGQGRGGMTSMFSASGQDDFLRVDVLSQNQFRRICLIN
jgi:hypothetical protein